MFDKKKYMKRYMKKYIKQYKRTHKKQTNASFKRYYYRNRDLLLATRKVQNNKVKLVVFNYYSHGRMSCACCNENHIEFLELDHANGGGNRHRKRIGITCSVNFYRWLIRNNFPDGYRILCSNCNKSIGNFQYCPHTLTI